MNLSFKNAYIPCNDNSTCRPQLGIRLYQTKISDDLFQLFDNIKTIAN